MKLNPDKSRVYVVLFAVIVSGVFTGAIMALHVATEPIVRANERLLTEKAIVEVFGLGNIEEMSPEQTSDLIRRRVAGLADGDRPGDPRAQELFLADEETGERIRILVAYKTDLPSDRPPDMYSKADILGYAFRIRGAGFWAMIEGWLAVEPSGERVLGVIFTNHQETPGLGGRITEKSFRDQFKGLNISPPSEAGRFVYIARQKPRRESPRHGRHVDSITGATGTSTAVEGFMNKDIGLFHRVAEVADLLESIDASSRNRSEGR